MNLSLAEFDREIAAAPAERRCNIIFIGMSGAGKTHWARLFSAKYGYPHIEIDDLIGHSPELHDLLASHPGPNMAQKMGHYLGMPWSEDFDSREKDFLAIERRYMSGHPKSGAVLDLTGSAIYHPEALCEIVRTGLVIYLQSDADAYQRLFETFMAHPKPVCWQGVYATLPGETPQEALARCYPLLLKARAGLYERYADVTVPFAEHKAAMDVTDFVEALRRAMPSGPSKKRQTGKST